MAANQHESGRGTYDKDIIQAGNRISKTFLQNCRAANDKTYAAKLGILNTETGVVSVGAETGINEISLQTDGTGTKAEIYCHAFEGLFRKHEEVLESLQAEKGDEFTYENIKDVESFKDFFETSVEIWELMLMDIVAMNVDDFKHGELGLVMSNIIDINTLGGIRGVIFEGTFGIALNNVITQTGIAITAGETAGLGHAASTRRLKTLTDEMVADIENIVGEEGLGKAFETLREINDLGVSLARVSELFDGGEADPGNLRDIAIMRMLDRLATVIELSKKGSSLVKASQGKVSSALERNRAGVKKVLETMYFNLAGSAVSVLKTDNKLAEGGVRSGDSIIALTETPSKDGIIGPRANGLTDIRGSIIELAGEMWEDLSYVEFVQKLDPRIQEKLHSAFGNKYNHLPMWKIATGLSTSFNMLIADKMLGGMKSDPNVALSGMAHMTGGPGFKLLDSLDGDKTIQANVDLSKIYIPDIIQILQIITGISDEDAMKKWNMGFPYVLYCRPGEEKEVLKIIDSNKFLGQIVGKVVERKQGDPAVTLKGVGMGNSNIAYSDEE